MSCLPKLGTHYLKNENENENDKTFFSRNRIYPHHSFFICVHVNITAEKSNINDSIYDESHLLHKSIFEIEELLSTELHPLLMDNHVNIACYYTVIELMTLDRLKSKISSEYPDIIIGAIPTIMKIHESVYSHMLHAESDEFNVQLVDEDILVAQFPPSASMLPYHRKYRPSSDIYGYVKKKMSAKILHDVQNLQSKISNSQKKSELMSLLKIYGDWGKKIHSTASNIMAMSKEKFECGFPRFVCYKYILIQFKP
jgi:uncharacterized protein YeeX (DUF496 family)